MKKGYWIALIFMLVCNLMLFYVLMRKKTGVNEHLKVSFSAEENLVTQGSYVLYESLGISLKNMYIFGNSSKDSTLIDYCAHEPHLVFRYNMEACTPCVANVISAIKEVFPDYATNGNIIFSCKGLKSGLNVNFNGKTHYSFGKGILGIPIEEYNIPYLFVLDENLKLDFLFVVYPKGNKQTLIDYLNLAKVRFHL